MCRARLIGWGKDHFHQNHPTVRLQRAMAVLEDQGGSLVIPIVKDLLENVDLRPAWNLVEEVARGQLAPMAQTLCFDHRSGALDHVRQVEQDSAGVGVMLENRRQQHPVGAAHVGDSFHLGEIHHPDQLSCDHLGKIPHRQTERIGILGVLAVPLPKLHSEHGFQARSPTLEGLEKFAPRLPVRRIGEHHREVSNRTGNIRPQRFTEGSKGKPGVLELAKNADAGQRPHHSMRGIWVDANGLGDLFAGAGLGGNPIGYSESGHRSE